ncbi:MAG TPA: catalase-related domain-containing protein, partial [Polyangiaceae bacterium]|nr:catalase-related domain-containing protein [Polyangiaceae bacterium]
LGGGCPFQAGSAGFTSFREPIEADKVRGKPERFADHYTQATLFYASQTPVEKAHILRAFRFELTKVQVPAVRQRVVAMLANVDAGLAEQLAAELGMPVPDPMPRALEKPVKAEVTQSPALSLFARPGDGSIRTRRVAILVADGVDGDVARALHAGLVEQGAVPRYLGARLGSVETETGDPIEVEATLETMPSVLFDALALPGGKRAVAQLGKVGHALEFIGDQYRHAKPIFVAAAAAALVETAGVPTALPSGERDPGLISVEPGQALDRALAAFVKAIARHRHHERETDPPAV